MADKGKKQQAPRVSGFWKRNEENCMEMAMAATGFGAGLWFGKRQLVRWKLWSRRMAWILAGGSALIFLTGGFLMIQYGYHFLKMIRYWVLMYGLLLLALVDSREKRIPNRALAGMCGVRAILLAGECACFPEFWSELMVSSAAGMAGGSFLFWIAGLVARKGIGMGDVKMIGVMGFYLGFSVLMSDLILTMTLTLLGGMAALLVRKASLGSELAFAPFAAAGTILTVLMGF